ncbi:ExbD/TolR family protein [Lentibacter sp. XHP0401]|uniref:ExbD/TolR family protein n=1 Tax=Lentibacter sp. XHP0401 TaxID=2984334 RepID=UPI0021E7410E|nr:biopolymer transporter ExbD [Lentibacter sp. XHP0401]MCV2892762.1 biopolymer transporter ExbD [Lentibacter sp. XHP0401]
MQIETLKRKPRSEAILPMINVVFLLLIFFLMSAQLSSPDPVEITPPLAAVGEPAEASLKAFIDRGGALYFEAEKGAKATAALAAALAKAPDRRIELRADALAPAQALTRVMTELAAAGAVQVDVGVNTP